MFQFYSLAVRIAFQIDILNYLPNKLGPSVTRRLVKLEQLEWAVKSGHWVTRLVTQLAWSGVA